MLRIELPPETLFCQVAIVLLGKTLVMCSALRWKRQSWWLSLLALLFVTSLIIQIVIKMIHGVIMQLQRLRLAKKELFSYIYSIKKMHSLLVGVENSLCCYILNVVFKTRAFFDRHYAKYSDEDIKMMTFIAWRWWNFFLEIESKLLWQRGHWCRLLLKLPGKLVRAGIYMFTFSKFTWVCLL